VKKRDLLISIVRWPRNLIDFLIKEKEIERESSEKKKSQGTLGRSRRGRGRSFLA
jgi:hypothetical protein